MSIAKNLSNIVLTAALGTSVSPVFAQEVAAENTTQGQSTNTNYRAPDPKILERSVPICEDRWLGIFKRCSQTTLLETQETEYDWKPNLVQEASTSADKTPVYRISPSSPRDVKQVKNIYVQHTTCDVNTFRDSGSCLTEVIKFGEASLQLK